MRIGLLWRAEWDPPHRDGPVVEQCKLHGVFAAFAALGVPAEPVVYSDETAAAVREHLLRLDGVLVWVNPIEHGRDRSSLDPLLREVAEAGVWVSAHPDVILKMATKKVLVDTREMDWGSDTRLYTSARELAEQLPGRLADGEARVLKQLRGMGGQGVWKVDLDSSGPDPWIVVQEGTRSGAPERVRFSEFVSRCETHFEDDGLMVEQPFLERIAEGMIRCYLSHDRVVGFAHQHPAGLRPASAGEPPAGKVFELPSAPAFATLRRLMESTWTPQMQRIVGVDADDLPVIWDADFLYGAKTDAGDDTYVLCEINASSTFAFPEHAMPTVARAALDRIASRPSRRQCATREVRSP